jgi:hypothetical protein
MRSYPGPLFLFALPLLSSLAFCQTPATPGAAQECLARADGFLQARLPLWQKRLQLDDWKISVVISSERDLKPNTLGNIHWETGEKSATIRVLHPAGYQLACGAAIQDEENTLVHEMVHLELSSLPRSMESRKDEENAVNRIAAALLQLGSVGAGEAVATAAGKSGATHGAADRKATPSRDGN